MPTPPPERSPDRHPSRSLARACSARRPLRPALAAALCALMLVAQPAATQQTSDIPHLQRNGAAVQLMVDGAPFLVIGGELHNSSASSLRYMAPIWPELGALNLNTVLAVVSWGQVEPREGEFDFAIVDGLIREARGRDLRLVLLWFGSWKNGLSHYAPEWVKRDYRRFPRAHLSAGATEVLTPLSEANREADARAFGAFMGHLREVDSNDHTVIMVQVENEVGLLGDSRDRGPAAEAAFAGRVPTELMDYLRANRDTLLRSLRERWEANGGRASGSWAEVFGPGPEADELFMAWHYARYLNRLAEVGKAEYPLPLFVNAWIVQPGDSLPGDYPSGGPQAHVHDLWKAGAPLIDILAPDIYLPDFPAITAEYRRSGTPLFVPESRAGQMGAANAFFAIGAQNAIGYSPFGIESREPDPGNGPLSRAYALIGQLAPQILAHQAQGTITGIWLSGEAPTDTIRLGGYLLEATLAPRARAANPPEHGYAIVLAVAPDEYLVAGSNLQVTFAPATEGPAIAGLATVEEGTFVDGAWLPGRQLSGDEVMVSYDMSANAAARRTGTGLRFASDPSILRVRLYRYE